MTPQTDPILYSFRRCPYAMRARLALAISGTRYELREVKLSAKPPEMLLLSPKGTVPVLVLPDGRVIDESLDIMHWALGQHDPEDWLSRNDAALIAANDGPFKQHLDRHKYPERYGVDPNVHRAAGLDMLIVLEDRLACQSHLSGTRRGLTDAAILPFVRQFARVDADWFAEQALPHLGRWLEGYLASELFEGVMKRVKSGDCRSLVGPDCS
jgi:glutathione S-transferase